VIGKPLGPSVVVADKGVSQALEDGELARFQSTATTFPFPHANSIVVMNPLHAFASPYYTLTPSGIMSNDRLFWGALMVVGAILVAVLLWARVPREWWRCAACGYNLTGLTNPSCPECGASVDQETLHRLQQQWPQSRMDQTTHMGDVGNK
jgi:hypothetical protein